MLADKLRSARLRAGMTQSELGQAIGKHKIYICQLERNYCLPTEQDLQRLCDVLHVTTQDLDFSQVITRKTGVITHAKPKPSVITHRFAADILEGDFPLLTKTNLKKCGYKTNRDFLLVAYRKLEQQLKKEVTNGKK